jgi:ADP-heptose:LPS heptosyltransferase
VHSAANGTGKRAERAAKALFLRALARMVGPGGGTVPDWDARPYRVLYVRHDGIGDMIMATGTLRAIATSHPTISLDVLTHSANARVLEGNPFVRWVLRFRPGRRWAYGPRVIRAVRHERYDVVVDGMMRRYVDCRVQRAQVKTSTVLLLLGSGAPHRIGMGGRPNDFVYTTPVTPPDERTVHHAEYSAALAAPFGVDPAAADLRPRLYLSDAERAHADRRWESVTPRRESRRLLVNISANNARRWWPDDRYVAVLRRLAADTPGVAALVIGSPAERAAVERVARSAGAHAYTPELREAFALVATAGLLLTPDTSLGHAAAAVGTPAVVMLPRGHEHLVPYGGAGRNLFGPDGTVASIGAEETAAALRELLR